MGDEWEQEFEDLWQRTVLNPPAEPQTPASAVVSSSTTSSSSTEGPWQALEGSSAAASTPWVVGGPFTPRPSGPPTPQALPAPPSTPWVVGPFTPRPSTLVGPPPPPLPPRTPSPLRRGLPPPPVGPGPPWRFGTPTTPEGPPPPPVGPPLRRFDAPLTPEGPPPPLVWGVANHWADPYYSPPPTPVWRPFTPVMGVPIVPFTPAEEVLQGPRPRTPVMGVPSVPFTPAVEVLQAAPTPGVPPTPRAVIYLWHGGAMGPRPSRPPTSRPKWWGMARPY